MNAKERRSGCTEKGSGFGRNFGAPEVPSNSRDIDSFGATAANKTLYMQNVNILLFVFVC